MDNPNQDNRPEQPPQEPRHDPDRRATPPGNNNIAWYLLGAGILVLLLYGLVGQTSRQDLAFGDLRRLIKQGEPAKNPDAAIEVTEGQRPKLTVRYSDLQDLTVGPDAITGKITRQIIEPADQRSEPKQIAFTTSRYGFTFDDGDFANLLEDNGFGSFQAQDPPSGLSVYMPLIIITAVFILIFFLIMRRLGGAGSAMAFGRSRGRLFAQEDIGVTFDDVAGIDEAVDELREVVDFLKTPEKFRTLGGRIPKGVLLVGPPGTGKTLLAKAIAGEAGVPFFSLSGSDFVEMFVGVGAARVRDMFQQAQMRAPCIVFIDELDALGKTRSSSVVGGHDEREQTLNALLVEMDGFNSNSGVIVMGATNRPETLDPALLRPGRFDRHVLVDRPDVRGREQILSVHIRNVKLDESVDLKEVAGITSGFVGADLENLINEAALLAARRNKDSVTMDELTEAVERVTTGLEKKQRIIHEDEKQRVAYHESAHALVAYCLPNTDPVHKVSIIPRGLAALGYTLQRPEGDRYLMTKSELASRIQVLLAGTVAEEMVLEDVSTGAQNDLERATELARSMVMDFGMSRLGRVSYREGRGARLLQGSYEPPQERYHSEVTAREIDQEIRQIIDDAIGNVREVLDSRRAALEALSDRLIQKEVIDYNELKSVIEANSPGPAIVPGTSWEVSQADGGKPTGKLSGGDSSSESRLGDTGEV